MARDMLSGVGNEHKYIIFLSDGFPTTYVSDGYNGYDPYDPTGAHFYDKVLNKPCAYGASYSDEAAIRARKMASAIKGSGITIFSIGIDVGGQTIQQYITQSENSNGFSVVDRTGTSYEIGDASSDESYKNWLRNSIGSGYYYDSTNLDGMNDAYNKIFAEIKHEQEEGSKALWVTTDAMPQVVPETVEFIGLYDRKDALQQSALIGESGVDKENTASYSEGEHSSISWDLKKSGYTAATSGGTTIYSYTLRYRVRLKNEGTGFTERGEYDTNGPTSLTYRVVQTNDGQPTFSEDRTLNYSIPAVEGYLAELTFRKVDGDGKPLAGAEFTLSHDTKKCGYCRGDGKSSVEVPGITATSDADGQVRFERIPSGHIYCLTETAVPGGYRSSGNTYTVRVAYDQTTVTVQDEDGNTVQWDSTIVNQLRPRLPETGGSGVLFYTIGGIVLMAVSLLYGCASRRRRERRQKN